MKSFKDLIPTMIQQFTEKEIEICCFQYRNLLKRVKDIKAEDDSDSNENIIYFSLKYIVYRIHLHSILAMN